MENIIQVLPDHIANQIAAGEVIQRPASVVKELVENAIDAGATQIDVVLKEAGRNLIRVTDNGKGMSPEDARLSFERHATSKIRQATDLFQLRTMGFRGEALASIASVAQVELVTRRPEDELAWRVEIEGSAIRNEEPTLAAQGSRFTIRNLFYNIPARRKFLGENTKELKAIRDEFIQIALVNPGLVLSLTHNDDLLFQLSSTNFRQRILQIFGKRNGGQLAKQLYPVDVETQLVKITGFVGDPAAACQRDQMQFMFVNNRFIRHKNFRSAIMKAYELLIPPGMQPTFFLCFEVDPEALDVNIHPTKTEVKFEHESAIWPIVHATVREALGKFNAVPSIDFDREDAPEIRVFTGERDVPTPRVSYDSSYNPFKSSGSSGYSPKTNSNWDELFRGFEKNNSATFETLEKSWESTDSDYRREVLEEPVEKMQVLQDFGPEISEPDSVRFQLMNRYIVLQLPKALLLVDQHRAHLRIVFDRFLNMAEHGNPSSQTLLFPELLELDDMKRMALLESMDELKALGFNVHVDGTDFSVTAIPADIRGADAALLLNDLLSELAGDHATQWSERRSRLALRLAQSAAVPAGQRLSMDEMKDLVDKLFRLPDYRYTPDGKNIVLLLNEEELAKKF